ncbi:VOC family protein [Paeniglutamicibacter psychrophenolicus]|uniref:Catechol 2,3-dioxygenase-like lactoylglutathione lyase family enzyme n=1 Tax=Paeniglutamicibacter psychrophenolicus TaxID=257454 RepID=A0ABS4WB85_9MICC|nr:VOC family protein [Paeniglutamicibacter psychrophenolicus]MBP2373457.1 catechol 2,3-dioxygenase-like lactoylglutathione lyase family enzyme [Paeniglutamicibacter psychrophenolicus]
MSISFNHTIIAAKDREASAQFYVDLAEAHRIESWGPFTNLQLDDGVMLQFAEPPIDFPPQHYAFLVDDAHFERTYARIQERGIEHWADPQRTLPGQTNTEHGGRGVYLLDPAGHYIEFITHPYL